MIEDFHEKLIEIKIIDQISTVEIGEFNYNIEDLIVRKNYEQELQAFPLTRGQNCEVILAAKLNFLNQFGE